MGQRIASMECIVAYFGDTAPEGDAVKLAATAEGFLADSGDFIADGDRRQSRAVEEAVGRYCCFAEYFCRNKCGASPENRFLDLSYRFWKLYGSEGGASSESLTANLFKL